MHLSSGLVALGSSLLLTPAALLLLRRLRVLDHPNERSSHDLPVVRGGGSALAISALAAWALTVDHSQAEVISFGVVLGAGTFGLIGLFEDLAGVSAIPRFALQLAASGGACLWLLKGLEGPVLWQVMFGGGALLWLVAYVNGFNFMDGINGISGVQSFLAGLTWAWLGHWRGTDELVWGGLILAGAALGFLPYNFPKARLFLGDVGSYFLGGWQGGILVVGFRAGIPPEAVLAPLLIYLADTGLTLIRRMTRGEPWFEPHRDHVYQRLVLRGWSHPAATGLVGGFVSVCALVGLLTLQGPVLRATADLVTVLALVSYVALPGWLERRSARNAEVA